MIIKNKLISIAGGVDRRGYTPIFVRDANDTHYPYKKEVKNFDKFPRWSEYVLSEFYPEGILVHIHSHFAYLDEKTKKWDYVKAVDELPKRYDRWEKETKPKDLRFRVYHYWNKIPEINKAKFDIYGIIPYEEIVAIDKLGDRYIPMPHIYAQYNPDRGPFDYFRGLIKPDSNYSKEIDVNDFKRISFFPKTFPQVKEDRDLIIKSTDSDKVKKEKLIKQISD